MAGAIAGQGRPKAAPSRARVPRSWVGPLVVGACFGLGYGLCQRLFNLQVGELIHFGRNFDVQPFPGTSLESLRLRFGAGAETIRADLESLDQQRLQAEEGAKAAAKAKQAATSGDGGLAPADPGQGPAADQQTPSAPELPALPTAPGAPSLPPPAGASPGSRP